MSRRNLGPFIPSAERNPAYYVQGGDYWIRKTGSKYHLVRVGRSSEGRSTETLGCFVTLAEAVSFYEAEVRA